MNEDATAGSSARTAARFRIERLGSRIDPDRMRLSMGEHRCKFLCGQAGSKPNTLGEIGKHGGQLVSGANWGDGIGQALFAPKAPAPNSTWPFSIPLRGRQAPFTGASPRPQIRDACGARSPLEQYRSQGTKFVWWKWIRGERDSPDCRGTDRAVDQARALIRAMIG